MQLIVKKGNGNRREQFTISVAGRAVDGVCVDDDIYISISSLCRALEIDHRSQVRRIKRNEEFEGCHRQLLLKTSGGMQPATCLAVNVLQVWLEGIRTQTIDRSCEERLLFYQEHLVTIITTTFSASSSASHLPLTEVQSPAGLKKSLTLVDTPPASVLESETIATRYDLLANIPQIEETATVRSHLFDEDTALRESCLADLPQWTTDETNKEKVYYIASNQLQVYVSHPMKEIALSVALQRVGQLGMSTVLTGRIAFWLWNLRRNDPGCSANGWVALHAEEILHLRGISKHSRALAPGSEARISDGYYETKYKEQVYQDLQLLNDCYIRRYSHVLDEHHNEREFYFDAPYLRVSFMMERLARGDQVVGIAVTPGEWMPQKLRDAFHRFAGIDKKIFQLNPKFDQQAIFLALYLSERWRQQAQQAPPHDEEDPWSPYREPIRMLDLLEASVIKIDWTHLTARFANRIEAALQKLFEKGILGVAPCCLSALDRTHNWGKAWLEAYWCLLPALDPPESEQTIYQLPLLSDGGTPKKTRKRRSVSSHQAKL